MFCLEAPFANQDLFILIDYENYRPKDKKEIPKDDANNTSDAKGAWWLNYMLVIPSYSFRSFVK